MTLVDPSVFAHAPTDGLEAHNRVAMLSAVVESLRLIWNEVLRRQAATDEGRRMVIRSALKRACEAAGLRYGRKLSGITIHWGTRRTGASHMIQRNVDIKTVQAIGHWKHPDVVLEMYAETTTAALRRAVEMVGPHSRAVPGRGRK